jgi:hypothetical protein
MNKVVTTMMLGEKNIGGPAVSLVSVHAQPNKDSLSGPTAN